MALIIPRFRRESWYGRLYLRAYGADRGWLVRLRRMTCSVFRYAPYPTFPEGTSEAEALATLVDWRRRREDARDRAIAFHMSPPAVQPFIESGPKVSICPTFWKIVFALLVYCPIAVIRAVGSAIGTALRAAGSAIASAFRWVGRRYGRPIEYAAFSALALGCYVPVLYFTAILSYSITGHLMGRQGMSRDEAYLQAHEARQKQWRAGRREEIRQDYLATCARRIRENVEYAKERTWQPDLECPPDYGRLSHEEYARQCVGHDELRLAVIERLEGGDFNCATSGWNDPDLRLLFPTEADKGALAAWLGRELRKVFADALKAEIVSRERRLAEARKRDAAIIGTTTVMLLPVQQDPAAFYRRFTAFCRFNEHAKEWEMARGSGDEMTNATCAALAGLFKDQIADARSVIRWQGRRAAFRQYAPGVGKWLGLVVGAVFLLALLIVLLDRYIRAIGRALGWFWDAVLLPVVVWTCIIAFAPIWAPARFIVYPALMLIGRAWMLVWNLEVVRRARAAVDTALTATASAIGRFFAAIGEILADTWHLIRAFASAKWERLCPFIEWE